MPVKRARTKQSIADAAAAEIKPASPSKGVSKVSTSPAKQKKVKMEAATLTLNFPTSSISKELRNALKTKATSQFIMLDDNDFLASARRIADRILNGDIRSEADYKEKFPSEVKMWLSSKFGGKDLPRVVVSEYKRILSQHLCIINKNWYQYQPDAPSDFLHYSTKISSLNITFDNFWDDFVDITRPDSFTTMTEIAYMDAKGSMLPKKDAQQRFSDSYDVSV